VAISAQKTDAQRRIIAGIQFAAWRDDLVSFVSPSQSWTAGTDVKRARSLKQSTLTTARSRRRFCDCRDKDTTTTADQKITGARSEAVVLDQRPIIRPHLE